MSNKPKALATLQEEWTEYYSRVYPEGTGKTQHTQVMVAFFSGAFVTFNNCIQASQNLSEEEAEAHITAQQEHCVKILREYIASFPKHTE